MRAEQSIPTELPRVSEPSVKAAVDAVYLTAISQLQRIHEFTADYLLQVRWVFSQEVDMEVIPLLSLTIFELDTVFQACSDLQSSLENYGNYMLSLDTAPLWEVESMYAAYIFGDGHERGYFWDGCFESIVVLQQYFLEESLVTELTDTLIQLEAVTKEAIQARKKILINCTAAELSAQYLQIFNIFKQVQQHLPARADATFLHHLYIEASECDGDLLQQRYPWLAELSEMFEELLLDSSEMSGFVPAAQLSVAAPFMEQLEAEYLWSIHPLEKYTDAESYELADAAAARLERLLQEVALRVAVYASTTLLERNSIHQQQLTSGYRRFSDFEV